MMNQYGIKQYWENRYQADSEPFDWYQRYSALKNYLSPTLVKFPQAKILIIGCGNSRLSEELYMEGYKNIMNIDYSETCIRQMEERYSDYPEMKFMSMDCRDLSFQNSTFDIVIDKGTLDSILCGDDSSENAHKALQEIHRVLQPQGIYFCVSYGIPLYRTHYLKYAKYNWNLVVEKVQKTNFEIQSVENGNGQNQKTEHSLNYHYIYICEKQE
jgi:ubiquinone/menaquinone biosynthesis C-methylase UbiE